MKSLLTVIFFICITRVYSQKEVIQFSNDKYTVEANKTNGLLEGKYISKYKNGKIKAEGEYENNMRFGIWNVYDTTGKIIQNRAYQNGFEYTRIYPLKAKTGPASLFDTAVYHLTYNKKNYIDYFPVQERMVLYSKRIWKNIYPSNNKLLFKGKFLLTQIIAFLSDSTKNGYCSKAENFTDKISYAEIKNMNPRKFKIIKYKIKEDTFYDTERNLMETRIIGICPVIINKKTKDTSDLCWIYYPSIREQLAVFKIKDRKFPLIKNFDDLFFFRFFSGDIYKESNIYDTDLKSQSNTEEELKQKRLEIEIGMIETEHDFWLGFVRR